jgi:flagellar hook-associated protein 2
VQKIVTAFNDTVSFLSEQQKAASGSQADSIGRDPLVRSLRREITSAILADSSGGGVYSSLAQLGFTISRSGELSLDEAKLTAALTEHKEDVQALFFGTNGSDGVFGRFESAIETFTRAGGLLPNAQERLSDQASKIADRIADMEERLEIKRAALQRQFAAADAIIAQLNQQGSQIGQMSNSWY